MSEPPATKAHIDLRVLEPDRQPIANARVWILGKGGQREQFVGSTSANGGIQVPIHPPDTLEVVVRSQGHVWKHACLGIPATPDAAIEVTLQPAVRITGHFVDSARHAIASKGTVTICRKVDEEKLIAAVAYDRLCDGGLAACVSTTEAGYFDFDELEPGVEYRIEGAAPGLLSSRMPATFVASAGMGEILIPLEVMFAVVVYIQDRSGAMMSLPRDLLPQVKQSMSGLPSSGFEIVSASDASAVWASVNLPHRGLDKDKRRFAAVWLFRRLQESTAQLNFHWRAPGYEPVGIRVEPQDAGGNLMAYSVDTSRTKEIGSGRVVATVRTSDLELAAIREVGGECLVKLVMIPSHGEGSLRENAVALSGSNEVQWDAVDRGTYTLRVFADSVPVQASCSPQEFGVGDGHTSQVTVTLEALPALVLDVRSGDGSPYDGPLQAIVWWDKVILRTGEEGQRARITDFRRAPYCVVGAPQIGGRVQLHLQGFKEVLVSFPAARSGIQHLRIDLEKQANSGVLDK